MLHKSKAAEAMSINYCFCSCFICAHIAKTIAPLSDDLSGLSMVEGGKTDASRST